MRIAAAESLRRLGDPRAVEPLILCLFSDIGIQQAARNALEGSKPWPGGPRLPGLDPDWPKSEAARRVVPRLIAILEGRERVPGFATETRHSVMLVLGEIGELRALDPLIATLAQPHHKEPERFIRVLGGLNHPRAVAALLELLEYQVRVTEYTRRNELFVREIRDPEELATLLPLLEHGKSITREGLTYAKTKHAEMVVKALQSTKDEELLLGPLRTQRGEARRMLAEVLEKVGTDRAVDPLIAALAEETDSEVKQALDHALQRLTGRRFGEDATLWQRWRAQQGSQP